MSESEKQDMLDRKLAAGERWFTILFKAVQRDTKSALIVVLIFSNIYIAKLYLDLNKSSKDEMIAEIRRQVAPIERKQAEVSALQDSTASKVDEIKSNVVGIAENVNGFINDKKK